MFSHIALGTNDVAASKKFYDALLAAVDGPQGTTDDKGRVIYNHNGGMLMITKPLNGQSASFGNGSTIGFSMDSPEQADAWHAAGIANGGTSCEDPPGVRERGVRKLYLAYLRDPAGNKLCAIYRFPV